MPVNLRSFQIDLLFDGNDDAITLCEIKYTQQAFPVDKTFLSSLENKETVFKECTRSKKQLFWAIISANGIKKSFQKNENDKNNVTFMQAHSL